MTLALEKRYQVFVSSTYEDLKEERQEVIQALLALKCIPAGMELFPADDADPLTVIRKVIDDCDYYIVIVAGRYGSIDAKTGKSYTQLEYEYARARRTPTLAFLHQYPLKIELGKTEQTDRGKKSLKSFLTLIEKTKMVQKWSSPHHLRAVVGTSMHQLINDHPAVGWIRANQLLGKPLDEHLQDEILKLRSKIAALEGELHNRAIMRVSDLAHGDDTVALEYHTYSDTTAEATCTWDRIFSVLAPQMTTYISRSALAQSILTLAPSGKGVLEITEESLGSVLVQFRALGLIRSMQTIHGEMWTITKQGDAYMVDLLAHRSQRRHDMQED
jgi:hypothetical protein